MDVAFGNFRSLIYSLTISSYFMPMDFGLLLIIFSVILGAYYGLKIERETFSIDLNTGL